MILGIDGGLATFGYGVVDPRTCSVVAAGVLIQPVDDELDTIENREVRLEKQADLVVSLILQHDIETIAVETMTMVHAKGSAASKIAIGMSAGAVIMACRALGVRRRSIPPKTWQRGIVPARPGEKRTGAIDYAEVYAALAQYIDVETLLGAVAPSKRNHAIDGCGIALYAAIVEEKPFHVEARKARRA
jgi:Holliday junction resolvasome RuvABC endonuclease subunit